MQTIKERRSYERRSYERRSERRSQFHERDVSAAHIFNNERKKSAAHSILWWAQNEREKLKIIFFFEKYSINWK